MLTEQEMLEIAEKYMAFRSHDHIELKLYYEAVLKKPYGNIYTCDSKAYMETGVFKHHVPSGPFLVEKETGRIVNFGTARPKEFYIEAYENGTLMPSLDGYWYHEDERYSHK
jgi:hypothetical protein